MPYAQKSNTIPQSRKSSFLSNKCFVLDKIACFLSSTVDKTDKKGSAEKHMAYRKKHKAYILKYKALILK